MCVCVAETGSLTDDNRNVYNVRKSEEYQSNSYTPVPFNTQCEEQTIDQGKFQSSWNVQGLLVWWCGVLYL